MTPEMAWDAGRRAWRPADRGRGPGGPRHGHRGRARRASTTRCSRRARSSNSIFHFPRQMTFFTTPELLEIGGLPFVTPLREAHPGGGAALLPPRRRHLRPAARAGRRGAAHRARRATASGSTCGPRAATRSGARAHVVARHRLLRPPEPSGHCPARTCPTSRTTGRGPRLLAPARGGRGRQELGRHRRPRALPRGRPRDPRPPRRRGSPTRSSTGSSPTSRTGSRTARSPRASGPGSCASSPRRCTSRARRARTAARATPCSCSPATTPTSSCSEARRRVDPETLKPDARSRDASRRTCPACYVAGRRGLGPRDQPHLHRERPLPRRGHRAPRFRREGLRRRRDQTTSTGHKILGQGLTTGNCSFRPHRMTVSGIRVRTVTKLVHRLHDGPQPDVAEPHGMVVVLQAQGQLVRVPRVGVARPCGSSGR